MRSYFVGCERVMIQEVVVLLLLSLFSLIGSAINL
jgi:hypothetical protein